MCTDECVAKYVDDGNSQSAFARSVRSLANDEKQYFFAGPDLTQSQSRYLWRVATLMRQLRRSAKRGGGIKSSDGE